MPDWRPEVRSRLAPLDLPPAREAEIVDELAQHLSDREQSLLADGTPPSDIHRLLLDEIDDHDMLRDLRRVTPPEPGSPPLAAHTGRSGVRHIIQDVRYSVRSLTRDRTYTIAAVLALAIGIGGTSAIFGAIDAILLRPMPFPHADRLVVPVSEHRGRNIEMGSTTFADYMDWREQRNIFEAVSSMRSTNIDITGDGDPERVEAEVVSEEFFRLVDVAPLKGRTLQPADHDAKASRVTVIAHGLWQRRFGGQDVVGHTLAVGGVPHEIVGILPARSVWPDTAQLFLPMRPSTYNDDVRQRRDNMIFQTLARLRDDVSLEQGNTRVAMMAALLEQQEPTIRKGWTNRLVPLREYIVEADISRALFVLLAAVASVLLIVCANVANLALVRGQARARELAIRLSLGASRGRLVQQLVTESLVLAGVGVALGAGLAAQAMRGLAAMAPDGTPFVDTIELDGRVMLATMLTGVFAVILSGLLPALVTSGLRVGPALKDSSEGSGVSVRAARLRRGFVVIEIAAAVVLLVLSSLLIRSFSKLTSVAPGADVDRVLTARVALPAARYPDAAARARFYQDLVAKLRANPAVESAAAASFVPVGTGGFGLGRVFLAEGRPEPPAGSDVDAQWNVITPDYFRVAGIPLTSGRVFADDDRADSTPVMVVNEAFAKRMFPNESPLGKRVRSWRDENVLREVVGVTGDVRYWGLSEKPVPLVYVPHAQDSWGSMVLTVRARGGDPHALAPALRSAVGSIDPLLALARIGTMAEAAQASVAAQRYATLLLGVLAALAIVLAALGVYGVMSYVFALRRREMGIRLALGASSSNVYGIVFKYGFALTGIGLAIGAAAAIAASRWLSTLLFETSPADGSAWTLMVAAIAVAATLACLGPARRAANADPVSVLRMD